MTEERPDISAPRLMRRLLKRLFGLADAPAAPAPMPNPSPRREAVTPTTPAVRASALSWPAPGAMPSASPADGPCSTASISCSPPRRPLALRLRRHPHHARAHPPPHHRLRPADLLPAAKAPGRAFSRTRSLGTMTSSAGAARVPAQARTRLRPATSSFRRSSNAGRPTETSPRPSTQVARLLRCFPPSCGSGSGSTARGTLRSRTPCIRRRR